MKHSAAYPPALLGETEAAAYLAVSRTTLRNMPDGPPARKLGGRRVYARADLDAFAMSLPTVQEVLDEAEQCETDRAFQ